MPITFNNDTSATNVISYPYSTNFNNLPITSNILVSVLSFYQSSSITPNYTYLNSYSSNYLPLTGGTISGTLNATTLQQGGTGVSTLIANAISPLPNYSYLNSYTSNYISSNIIANVLTPYDTIALRNTALGSYPTYTYQNAYTSNYISSNIITNLLGFYSSISYSSNYISSNIIANVLTPYDTIALRNTALGSYPTYTYLNSYTSNYISSNIIANVLTPYDTIALRNTALGSYPNYTYQNAYTSNYISSNIITNLLGFYSPISYSSNFISSNIIANVLTPYDTVALRNTALGSYPNYTYLNSYTSNYISSNIIANVLTPYDTIALRNTALSSYPTYTYQNSYTSNYISSNNLTNILSFYTGSSTSLSYGYLNSYSSNFISSNVIVNLLTPYDTVSARNTALSSYLPLTGGTLTGTLIQNASTPNIQMGGTNGNNLGLAVSAGNFSTSAGAGDLVLRSINNLILQSGGGAGAIIINSANNISVSGTLTINNSGTNKIIFNDALQDTKLQLYSGYGLGIQGNTLLYTSANTHRFMAGATQTMILDGSGNLTTTGNVGIGTAPITNANLLVYGNYGIQHTGPNISVATMDSNNFGGSALYSAFAGDVNQYSYWGYSINLNNGGANPSGNAGNARIANTTSFTINQKAVGGTAISGFTNLFTVLQNGNVGIGTNNPSTKLDVRGGTITQSLSVVDATSYSSQYQLLIGAPTSTSGAYIQTIQQGIGFSQNLTLQASGGNVGIGTNNPNCKFQVWNGIVNINAGSPYAVPSNFMASGSLTIGDMNVNYGNGSSWNTNTAGLLMECLDNTEIAIHDSGSRVMGAIQYLGGATNKLVLGRDMGWGGISSIVLNGNVGIGSSSPGNKLVVYGDYTYLDGLRLRGTDTGNTIWNGNANMGITVNSAYTINIGMNGGNGNILTVNNSQVLINQATPLYIGAYWSILYATINSVINSLVFHHYDTGGGINSYWWFNGTQTSTMSEISDERSKRNIEDVNNALDIINQLKPKKFQVLKDKDIDFQYGFLAQDLEQIPETSNLVYKSTDYIANINSYGNHSNFYITSNDIIDNRSVITSDNDITGLVSIGDEIKFVGNNTSNQEFIIDDTPYANRYKRRYGKVVDILSSNQFVIDNEITNFNIDDPFLIYGKKVDDFKTLDYTSIIALNTKAIQELYEIVQQQQTQINLLLNNKDGP